MAEPQQKLMTADEFLIWNLSQEERYELEDGVPVPLHGMAGASNAHDDIAVNIIIAAGNKLRGGPCRPTTSDTAVRTSIRKVRRPDVTIECAPSDPASYEARNPLVVFEVLSRKTRGTDLLAKLEEYRRHPTLRHIVFVEQDSMSVLVYTRGDAGEWSDMRLSKPEQSVELPAVPVSITLAEIYQRVPLKPDVAAGDE